MKKILGYPADFHLRGKMKKRVFALSFFLLITIIGFVSSQGLGGILESIDEETVWLFAIFIIAFALLFFSLNKVFRGNTSIAGIISVVIAFLIVYAVNKTGLDVQGFFYGIGISQEVLGVILPIVIVAGIVLLIIKMAKNSLLVIGGLLILLSFFVYARTLLIVVGVILIVVRFFIKRGVWEPKKKEGIAYRGMGPF